MHLIKPTKHRGSKRIQVINSFGLVLLLALSLPLAELSHANSSDHSECEVCAHLNTNFDQLSGDELNNCLIETFVPTATTLKDGIGLNHKTERAIIRGPPSLIDNHTQ